MWSLSKPIAWLYIEFGVSSLVDTGRDAWFIILARTCRMFAFGAISLVIALFFNTLEFSDFQIGLFMSLTLFGDVLLSLSLSLVADQIGRRRILCAGGVLMAVSGAIFTVSENFWILLPAAVVGVISIAGGDCGPFRAIEESTLSHLTTPGTRSDVLSWYVTTSSLGSALGTEFSGRTIDLLTKVHGWDVIDAYHAIFWLYIVMGTLTVILTLSMTDKCELSELPQRAAGYEMLSSGSQQRASDADHAEEEEGREDSDPPPAYEQEGDPSEKQRKSLFAQVSSGTRTIMYKLWLLLAVDSLADGMVSYSLTNYYLDRKFHLSKSNLGDIMSAAYFLMSCSSVFAGPLARRLGLINTMVFTHLPSSTAVLLFPIPQNVPLTVILFFIRTGLNNMDQASRTAFIAAVVKPEERTAVMGITSMLRTLATTVGPSFTGLLAGHGRFWIAFVVAGALRISYDLGLFTMFVNMKLHTPETADEETPA